MKENAIRVVNILKGRLAEALIHLLFTENGYEVHRSGMEHILPLYAQREINEKDDVEEWVRRMPDFLVIKDGNSYFIEVKYVANFSSYFHGKFLYYPAYPKLFVVAVTPEDIDCRKLEDLQNGSRFDNVYEKFSEGIEALKERAKAGEMEMELGDAEVEEAFSRYRNEVNELTRLGIGEEQRKRFHSYFLSVAIEIIKANERREGHCANERLML